MHYSNLRGLKQWGKFTNLTAFFNIVPIVIAGFFGGTIVDRLGYKRMSVTADIASGLTVILVPILFGLGLRGMDERAAGIGVETSN